MLSIELSDHLSLMKRLAERGFYRSVASRLVKTNPEIARRIIVDPDVKPVFVYRGLNGITAQQFNPRFTKHFFGPEYEVNATTFFETALRDYALAEHKEAYGVLVKFQVPDGIVFQTNAKFRGALDMTYRGDVRSLRENDLSPFVIEVVEVSRDRRDDFEQVKIGQKYFWQKRMWAFEK